MSKRKDGVFSLLREILSTQKEIRVEQKEQTKMLQTIVSSQEQLNSKAKFEIDGNELSFNLLNQKNWMLTKDGIGVTQKRRDIRE